MKILYLLPEFVLPAQSGLRVRELSQLQLFSAILEVESINVLTFNTAPLTAEDIRTLKNRFPKVHVNTPIVRSKQIRRNRRALINFLRRRIFSNDPYLTAIYNDAEMHAQIERQLRRHPYDVVYISYLGMTPYIRTIKKHLPNALYILEQHNIEWQIFNRLADELRPPMRQMVRFEAYALKRREIQMMRAVDSVIAISKTDADELKAMSGVSPVVVPPYYEIGPPVTTRTNSPSLGYMGHLGWQPNVIGLNWFCEKVWPLVRRQVPDARLTIAGPGLQKDSNNQWDCPASWRQPGISVVGFVDNLQDLYSQTVGMVAPVVGGSGVRMKLLETMSAGMPTVTTPDGALGLDVQDGRELLIAGDAEGFAQRVVRLVSDSAVRETLRTNGIAFIENFHSKPVAIGRLKQALKMK